MAEDFRETIETFVLVGRQAGWSKATVTQYRWHLTRLALWLERHDVTAVDGITARLLLEYGAYQRDHWAPNTCKIQTIAIRSFLKTLVDQGLCSPELVKVLRVPRIKQRLQRTVTGDEVATMLASCDVPYQTAMTSAKAHALMLRNRAIVMLLFDSLLRAAELCHVRVEDIDADTRFLLVREGKGGKDGMVRFSEATAVHLRAWLEIRPFVALESEDALFVGITGNTPGQHLTPSGLRRIVRGISQRAGIKEATPHAFRRGGAVQAVRNGASSRVVMEWGRWNHLAMLETYTANMSAMDLYDTYAPMNGVEKSATEGDPPLS